MKTSAIFLACSLFAYAAFAHADCRPMEYAEIKDISSNELVETYCYYDAIANIHRKSRDEFQEQMLQKLKLEQPLPVINQIQRLLSENNAEQAAKINGCRQQQAKIETALKARSFRGNLACNTAGAK